MTRKKVLVVGDVLLDRYVSGTVDRLSQEAAVPVLRAAKEAYALGGAGNVAANAAAQGVQAGLLWLCGRVDPDADRVENLLTRAGIWHRRVQSLGGGYKVPRKTRFLCGPHQLLRVDDEGDPAPDALAARLVTEAAGLLPELGVLVLSDYAKGAVSDYVAQELIQRATRAGVKVVVDPKGTSWEKYRGATVITPNLDEARAWAGAPTAPARIAVPPEDAEALARVVAARLFADHAVVTAGADGLYWGERRAEGGAVTVTRAPAVRREVADVTGAGDTLVGVLAAELCKGADVAYALVRANAAAGVAVSRPGTVVVPLADVDLAVGSGAGPGKIVPSQDLGRLAAAHRDRGRKVGYFPGWQLAPGLADVRRLARAAAQCDFLVAGVELGPDELTAPAADRAEMLAAMGYVHAVAVVPELNELSPVRALRPDVVFLPRERSTSRVADYVVSHGGRVETVD